MSSKEGRKVQNYINGSWQPSLGKQCFEVSNAITEEALYQLTASSLQQVDMAVQAAKSSFLKWSLLTSNQRADYLDSLFSLLQSRQTEIAESITKEVGSTIDLSIGVQAAAAINKFSYYADHLRSYPFEERFGDTPVLHEPIGVVACVTPWNFPLLQIAAKVAPALATGCTVVLKPSEVSPKNAAILAECIDEAGFPAGVFNMVWGEGSNIGEYLVGHKDIDMVSFTGSTAAGRRIAALAGKTIKRTSMELGGKSAAIILDDADMETAIAGVLETCFVNAGQVCTAHSRLIVPSHRKAEAEEVAKYLAEQWNTGDPFDENTRLGPLVSEQHWQRVQSHIVAALSSPEIKLLTGGVGRPDHLDRGYFVKPTVFSNVQPDDALAQQEVFGPVIAILEASDDDTAIAIANNSIYGLSGGVWSVDSERAIQVAKRMRTGTVEINGGTFNGSAPFGGYKQSGLGREMGPYGFNEFLELKTLQV